MYSTREGGGLGGRGNRGWPLREGIPTNNGTGPSGWVTELAEIGMHTWCVERGGVWDNIAQDQNGWPY